MEGLFEALWADYAAVTPSGEAIVSLLERRGERIVNDHIALRTFERPGLGLEVFGAYFEGHGFEQTGEYAFEEKRLDALSFSAPGFPRVFVSSLRVDTLSAQNLAHVEALCEACPHRGDAEALLRERPSWPAVTRGVYQSLVDDSEYAGWLAAFGLRANHFTVSVNALQTFDSLAQLNGFLLEGGYELNGGDTATGAIQGSAAQLLEQSSTRADKVQWAFADGEAEIRSCYYEFAKRYETPDGALFDGFVPTSADTIFESTDR